jgi:hypothetical protein
MVVKLTILLDSLLAAVLALPRDLSTVKAAARCLNASVSAPPPKTKEYFKNQEEKETSCLLLQSQNHRLHIFTRDETGLVCLPTQLERTLQLYW